MGVLGRILQVVGWLWVVAGFFGPIAGFSVGSFLPGLIILFVARVLRTQAARRQRMEEDDQTVERPRVARSARPPSPATRPKPVAMPTKTSNETRDETRSDDQSESPPSSDRQETLEQIFLAGRELEDEDEPPESLLGGDDTAIPLTSAEMIARARARWDKKP